ncbi:MAG: hypothetical protein KAV25_03545 [Methanophagales archaeon]|nr:hypothetical protein [Methanophagales archaeon]
MFAIVGLLAVAYFLRRENEQKRG